MDNELKNIDRSVMEELMGVCDSISRFGVCTRHSSKLEPPSDHLVFVDGVPLWNVYTPEAAGLDQKVIQKALLEREMK